MSKSQLPIGVSLRLFVNQQEQEQEQSIDPKDGYVGMFRTGDRLCFYLTVDAGHEHLHVLSAQGKETIVPARDRAGEVSKKHGRRVYRILVTIGTNHKDGSPFINHRSSTFQVLAVGQAGAFQLYEVGMLMQQGMLFVLGRRKFDSYCYRDGNSLVVPVIRNWPGMTNHLKKIFEADWNYLPDMSEYKDLQTATVQWFNPWLGWGVASTNDGKVARFALARVSCNKRLICPDNGQVIRYREVGKTSPKDCLPELMGVVVS